jgi:hypothetical protein
MLSTIPMYMLMANQLPVWAIEDINRIRHNFFWDGRDTSMRGMCLVVWPTVCLSTIQGGLGV